MCPHTRTSTATGYSLETFSGELLVHDVRQRQAQRRAVPLLQSGPLRAPCRCLSRIGETWKRMRWFSKVILLAAKLRMFGCVHKGKELDDRAVRPNHLYPYIYVCVCVCSPMLCSSSAIHVSYYVVSLDFGIL